MPSVLGSVRGSGLTAGTAPRAALTLTVTAEGGVIIFDLSVSPPSITLQEHGPP